MIALIGVGSLTITFVTHFMASAMYGARESYSERLEAQDNKKMFARRVLDRPPVLPDPLSTQPPVDTVHDDVVVCVRHRSRPRCGQLDLRAGDQVGRF